MTRPRIDYPKWIKRIPQHVESMPEEAGVALSHYERSANDSWNLLQYFERNVKRTKVHPKSFDAHLHRLRGMVMLSLVEAFERFMKETAAVCIDQVGHIVLDDRLDVFNVKGTALASHFAAKSMGKSLCDGLTWLDCADINRRFRKILADPFKENPSLTVFPQPHTDKTDGWRYETMEIVWQLRHTIVHNVGVITPSDAVKLRLLIQHPVKGPSMLWPTNGDVWYVKLFLDDCAKWANERIGTRLAELLTTLHLGDPSLFDPGEKARELASLFRIPITIAKAVS